MAATVATTAALAVAGSGSPAVSAPDDQCPTAFPVSDLVAEQPVNGLTVSKGTTPEPFTGEVLGVLEDGIMPGRDMIMMRLTSPEVDRVGIWHGMSGSPVYAADGRLIGAVAYGLSFGPSTVAGVTPAADMHELLAAPPAGPAPAEAAEKVAIPQRLGKQLVADGLATRAEVDNGLTQLQVPFGMSGLSQKRVRQVAKKLDLDLGGMRLTGAGATAEIAEDSFVAGGNVAAAISYGDITAAGVGTVTAVCGDEVLGFGHPMLWSGPSTLSLHHASALYVQEDTTFSGFKLANVDAMPTGTITEDRMAGILGVQGAVPTTGDITSTVSMGAKSRDGETHVNVADWLPDLAFSHVLANQDQVFDGIGKGGADIGWTVNGLRQDGSPFSITRSDVHASEYDITFESAWDVIMALYTLEYNGVEDITITSVDVDSELTRVYDHYEVAKVEQRANRTWNELTRRSRVLVKPGKRAKFRVTLESPDSGTMRVVKQMRVPRYAEGMRGSLQVTGGNSYYDEDDFFFWYFEDESSSKKTFEEVLDKLQDAPRNDEVLVNLDFRDFRGKVVKEIERKEATGLVVDGRKTFRVKARG